MRTTNTGILTVAALLACTLPLTASNQRPSGADAPGEMSKDAVQADRWARPADEFYAELKTKLESAKTLTYDGIFSFGPDRDSISKNVVIERSPEIPKFRFAGATNLTVHDGETFSSWNISGNHLTSGDGDRAFIFRNMSMIIDPFVLDLGRATLSKLEGGNQTVSWGEVRDLDYSGHRCHELVIELSKETLSARISLWVNQDGLPRFWALLDPAGKAVRSAQYFNFKLDPELPPNIFELDVPEGVERESFDEVMGKLMDAVSKGEAPTQIMEVGSEVTDWELREPDGTVRKLSDHRGKIVLLDFWATWCAPCKLAMPGVQKLHEEYKDRGVVVYGVNVFETDEAAASKYLEQQKYTYGLLLKGDPLAKEYGFRGIPTFIVFDQEGRVAFSATGGANEGGVRKTIDKLLGDEPAENGPTEDDSAEK